MSEVIVSKAGGTSNATASAVEHSLAWAEQSDVFVVSAPGKLQGFEGMAGGKVTDILLAARDEYLVGGQVARSTIEAVTERYQAIADGLGNISLPLGWLDKIGPRVEDAVKTGEDNASILGERLQAEIYQGLGFVMLDPARAPFNIGDDQSAWREWLSEEVNSTKRYVLPGNTTRSRGGLASFSRGGSDISGGLAAYGLKADKHLNLTDGPAFSADPTLIDTERLVRIDHLTYQEGREFGRNGTGLVHPAAMVPLMNGDIPTEIRSTFDPGLATTLLDNDYERAGQRQGLVVGLSLMEDMTLLSVHEPGMSEAVGRLAVFEGEIAKREIALIDSLDDGVDRQTYMVDAVLADEAEVCLAALIRAGGTIERSRNLSFITLIGYRLETRFIDILDELSLSLGLRSTKWQLEHKPPSIGPNRLRFSVEPGEARDVMSTIHANLIET